MKKCFCKLQASVPIHSTTGGYANVEGSLQIKKCRKYAQHAIKCNFLYQSHTQGSFIPIFPLIFASVLFRIFLCLLYYQVLLPLWCFSEDLVWPGAVCAPWNPFLLHHFWSLTNLLWWKGSEPSTLQGVISSLCDEIPTCWPHQKGRVSTPGCRSSRRDEQSPHPPLSTPGCGSAVPIHKKFIFPGFYLFDVEEVLGIEGDGSAWDRNIFIQSPTVTHVGLDSKCYRFGLQTEKHIQKHFSSIKIQPWSFHQVSRAQLPGEYLH